MLNFGCFLVSVEHVGYTLPTPMARAKSDRARSKTLAIDDLTQSIEQLQAFIPKLEDLGREGFPYLEGALARTELQLRECIKRAFGDKSPEFHTHRQLKLALSSSTEKKQTLALIRNLIASLEDKKLELQGLKPAVAQETAASPTPSKLTLVPSAVMPTQGSVALVGAVPQPTATTLHLVPAPEKAPTPAPEVVAAQAAADTPSAPVVESGPAPAPPPPSIPPRKPIEPISSLFRTQEMKPLPLVVEQSPAASATAKPERPAAAAAPMATPVASPDPATPAAAPAPMVEPAPFSAPAPPPSTATASASTAHKSPASAVPFSTTQEVPAPAPSIIQQAPPPPPTPAVSEVATADMDCLTVTKRICQRFHAVARQLRLRGEYRSTVNVEDEQDVQDLVHALLRQHFDDIGTDEWTPPYSNGESRTTFLLDHDRLAIIVKKTRAGLSRKDLTDQVRADAERYRARGRCMQLLCFVYDPEGRIGNPRGLENELTSTSEHFTVDVVVAPKS